MSKETNHPKLRLFADRILVKIIKPTEEKTIGGIIIPTIAVDPAKICKKGEVVLMSKKIEEHLEGDTLEIGEVVLFSQYAGSDVEFKSEEYKILRITDLFGVDED